MALRKNRKLVLTVLAATGIVVASLGVSMGHSQSGGCGSCGKASVAPNNLDGGGDHHFPDGSQEIEEGEH